MDNNIRFGFGMLRLPVINGVNSDVDIPKVCELVDEYLKSGYNYFDTSFVYHGGHSEEATRKAVVERHPRDSFTITSKLPTGRITSRENAEEIFNRQLKNCGVEYFDYYLLHNTKGYLYDRIIEPLELFGFIAEKKAEGKIKSIGFSFHDCPEDLDRILTAHPEVDFVQIVLNYYDWTSCWVRSKECYEVIRKHGKKVIIMEPVKAGMLAHPPKTLEEKMRKLEPEMSPASWAFRFTAGLDGVIAILSGMNTLSQVRENTKLFKNLRPLTGEETQMLIDSADDYREMGPLGMRNFSEYRGIAENGMPVECILEAYNAIKIQNGIGAFAIADNNYYEGARYRAGINGCSESWIDRPIIDRSGNDITEMVREAEKALLY